ncbi:nucleotidyltransferase family protein [Methanorbis furvi]|uniref:protein adenylyltransferase n=1 Tax=Methanorbis furvi TaxID=3028299 RepID=A0AAE4MBZ5_9EURY|nr:hypothetical protein [Methanocorpusculaceae archaeon Ag1]
MSAYTSIKPFVLKTLTQHLSEIQAAYGIQTLTLFGSVARGDDMPDSDIDLLYTFASAYDTFDNYLALAEYLETILGRKVDLISPEYLKPRIRTRIEKDAITCGEGSVSA